MPLAQTNDWKEKRTSYPLTPSGYPQINKMNPEEGKEKSDLNAFLIHQGKIQAHFRFPLAICANEFRSDGLLKVPIVARSDNTGELHIFKSNPKRTTLLRNYFSYFIIRISCG